MHRPVRERGLLRRGARAAGRRANHRLRSRHRVRRPARAHFWIGELDPATASVSLTSHSLLPTAPRFAPSSTPPWRRAPRCCTNRACGPSTTPTTTARSCATPTATTSKRSVTRLSDGPRSDAGNRRADDPDRHDRWDSARIRVVPSRRRPKTPAAEPPDPIQRFAAMLRESDEREQADRERERLEREAAEDAARAASEHAAALAAPAASSSGRSKAT